MLVNPASPAQHAGARSSALESRLVASLGAALLPLQMSDQKRALAEVAEEDAQRSAAEAAAHREQRLEAGAQRAEALGMPGSQRFKQQTLADAAQRKEAARADAHRADFRASMAEAQAARRQPTQQPAGGDQATNANHHAARSAKDGGEQPATTAQPARADAGRPGGERGGDAAAQSNHGRADQQHPQNPTHANRQTAAVATPGMGQGDAQRASNASFATTAAQRVAGVRGAVAAQQVAQAANAATTARSAASAPAQGGPSASGATHATVGSAANATGAANRSAPAHAAARTSTTPNTDAQKADAPEQVVRVLRQQIRSGRVQSTMRLDPPELGPLRLKLDVSKDAVRLQVFPVTEMAHRLLSRDMDVLQQGLEALGLRVERMEVRVAEPPQASAVGRDADAETLADPHEDASRSDPRASEQHERDATAQHGKSADDEPGSSAAGMEADGHDLPEPAAERLVNLIA